MKILSSVICCMGVVELSVMFTEGKSILLHTSVDGLRCVITDHISGASREVQKNLMGTQDSSRLFSGSCPSCLCPEGYLQWKYFFH